MHPLANSKLFIYIMLTAINCSTYLISIKLMINNFLDIKFYMKVCWTKEDAMGSQQNNQHSVQEIFEFKSVKAVGCSKEHLATSAANQRWKCKVFGSHTQRWLAMSIWGFKMYFTPEKVKWPINIIDKVN